MSNDTVIRVENLSKSYRLGVIGRHTLQEEITYWWHKFRGRDPARHMGRVGLKGASDARMDAEGRFWALEDISFEVRQGQVLGIIGRNGAGKSTLLKILTRITEPSKGQAILDGRVASLLEVGTGFHAELTGRENVYLNGAILGMKRAEIERKFGEIVDFSEIGEFIDTPVKRYSSGMYVRLAFAVAAHLEPEIMLVDEVLAVGDVQFQKKCLGKMKDVAGEGRTILFVSHNMGAIRNLCERILLLDKGRLVADGPADHVIARYLDRDLLEGATASAEQISKKVEGVILKENPYLRLEQIALMDCAGNSRKIFHSDEGIVVSVTFRCFQTVKDLRLVVYVVDEDANPIMATQTADDSAVNMAFPKFNPGTYTARCDLPANTFGERSFFLSVHLIYPKMEHIVVNKILEFEVKFRGYENVQYGSNADVFFRPNLKWAIQPERN